MMKVIKELSKSVVKFLTEKLNLTEKEVIYLEDELGEIDLYYADNIYADLYKLPKEKFIKEYFNDEILSNMDYYAIRGWKSIAKSLVKKIKDFMKVVA